MRPLIALALLAVLAPAAPVPKALKKKDDKALLVGTWKVTCEDGKAGASIHTHTYRFDEDGNQKQWYGKGADMSEWTWAIDPEASPKRMTWVSQTQGTFECVYELSGEGLKMAYTRGHQKQPPTAFTGPGVHLIELVRDTTSK